MKRLLYLGMVLFAACGGATTGSSASTGGGSGGELGSGSGANGASASGAAAGSNGASNGSAGATSGDSGSSGGNCVPLDSYAGDASLCCSQYIDGNGYCEDAPAGGSSGATTSFTTGDSGSTGSSATTGVGTGGTGTTTGGTCPNNMPNLVTGQGGRGVGPCNSGPETAPCPKGYQCIQGECTLNSSSTLQVTLSSDDIEDFDLHLLEPLTDGGYCEIYYGNAGTDPDAGASFCNFAPQFCHDGGFGFPGMPKPCPVGWLDRDTNAACGQSGGSSSAPDGVNVENILFPNWEAPPSGTYYVRVDYWENCDSTICSNYSSMDPSACNGHPSSHIGLQVRMPDSSIWQYCPDISLSGQGPNDHGQNGAAFPDNGNEGSGFFVTSFQIP